MTYSLSKLCDKLKIIAICLYPNATRILQPADVSIFKPLKNAWLQEVQNWRRDNLDKSLTRLDFAPLLKSAIDKSIKKHSIINGFRACGLYPFNADAVDYSKCLGKNIGETGVPREIEEVPIETPEVPREIAEVPKKITEGTRTHENKTITYDRFKEIVGPDKILQLQQYDPNKDPCSSDFATLHQIYKEFQQSASPIIQGEDNDNEIENIIEFVLDDQNIISGEEMTPQEVSQSSNMEKGPRDINISETPIIFTEGSLDISTFLQTPKTPTRAGRNTGKEHHFIITSTPYRRAEELKQENKRVLERSKEENRIKREENKKRKEDKRKKIQEEKMKKERLQGEKVKLTKVKREIKSRQRRSNIKKTNVKK